MLCSMFSSLVDFFSAQNAAVNKMRLTGVYSKYFQDLDKYFWKILSCFEKRDYFSYKLSRVLFMITV